MFTEVEVLGTFSPNPEASASGTLIFTLTRPMQNGDHIANPEPIKVTLGAGGTLAVKLYATDDAATVPQGVLYGVTEQIENAQPRDYFIAVPHAATEGKVDISTLTPGELGWQ